MDDDKKILVLGLGNDCLGDDAVGPMVVRELRRRRLDGDEVDFLEAGASGLVLLDLIAGYRGLILIDAIQTGSARPGRIYRLAEHQLPAAPRADESGPWSAHHMGLRQILQAGRRAGCSLPETVIVYAVETAPPREWHRGCSREVQRAIPKVVRRVIQDLRSATARLPGEGDSR
jgi:hydrogenase maturation protease